MNAREDHLPARCICKSDFPMLAKYEAAPIRKLCEVKRACCKPVNDSAFLSSSANISLETGLPFFTMKSGPGVLPLISK